MGQIYSLADGMRPIDTSEKKHLRRGVVLHWGGNMGWPAEDFVISENHYLKGRYFCLSLEHEGQSHWVEAFNIVFSSEKVRHSQYFFVTDRALDEGQLARLEAKHTENKRIIEARLREEQKEIKRLAEIGRLLAEKHIPREAKALIVAAYEEDKSDIMTDYFATCSRDLVVLGWSRHTRDIFSEMRKHAHKIPETAHLSTPPKLNSNDEPKNDHNDRWWHPSDEHREKYSLGAGYYLKAGNRYSTGWKIYKARKWGNDWTDDVYTSLGERCVL